jgi:hypothetical protein
MERGEGKSKILNSWTWKRASLSAELTFLMVGSTTVKKMSEEEDDSKVDPHVVRQEAVRKMAVLPDRCEERILTWIWEGGDGLRESVESLSGKQLREAFARLTFTENYLQLVIQKLNEAEPEAKTSPDDSQIIADAFLVTLDSPNLIDQYDGLKFIEAYRDQLRKIWSDDPAPSKFAVSLWNEFSTLQNDFSAQIEGFYQYREWYSDPQLKAVGELVSALRDEIPHSDAIAQKYLTILTKKIPGLDLAPRVQTAPKSAKAEFFRALKQRIQDIVDAANAEQADAANEEEAQAEEGEGEANQDEEQQAE